MASVIRLLRLKLPGKKRPLRSSLSKKKSHRNMIFCCGSERRNATNESSSTDSARCCRGRRWYVCRFAALFCAMSMCNFVFLTGMFVVFVFFVCEIQCSFNVAVHNALSPKLDIDNNDLTDGESLNVSSSSSSSSSMLLRRLLSTRVAATSWHRQEISQKKKRKKKRKKTHQQRIIYREYSAVVSCCVARDDNDDVVRFERASRVWLARDHLLVAMLGEASTPTSMMSLSMSTSATTATVNGSAPTTQLPLAASSLLSSSPMSSLLSSPSTSSTLPMLLAAALRDVAIGRTPVRIRIF